MPEDLKNENQKVETATPRPINQQIDQVLRQAQIKNEVIPLPDNKFSEVIVLGNKKEAEGPAEKTVRLYRGVNNIDKNFGGTPYAMRTIVERNGESGVEIMDNLQAEVNNLAQDPTYENLLKYADKARPGLQANEVKWLERDIEAIEEAVLKGRSVRYELNFKQVMHGGGAADTGLTPYVSASPDPVEAAKFGRVLMALDVPASMISDLNSVGNGEVNLKGVIDPKYITALIPHEYIRGTSDEEFKANLDQALKVLDQRIGAPALSAEESIALRQEQLAKELENDKKQQPIDLQLVRQKRVERLAKNFPEANIDLPLGVKQDGVDIYSQAKEKILDYYASRLGAVWKEYAPHDSMEEEIAEMAKKAGQEDYSRQNISEALLQKIKQRVGIVEAKVKDSREARKVRDLIANTL